MASGKGHDLSILIFTPVTAYIAYTHFTGECVLSALGGYLVGGFLLSPDIDLKQSVVSRRWLIFSLLWYPYRKLSGHRDHSFYRTLRRGSFSHFPLIGSATRLLYLLVLLYLGDVCYDYFTHTHLMYMHMQINSSSFAYLMSVYVGFEISALVHLVMDFTYPLNKL